MLALGYAGFACGVEGEITGLDAVGGPNSGPDAAGLDGSRADAADAGSIVTAFGDASLVISPEIVDLLAGGDAGRVQMELKKQPGDLATIESVTLTPAVDVTVSPPKPSPSLTVFDFDLRAGPNSTPQRVPISVVVRVAGAEKTLALTARVSRHYRLVEDTVIQNVAFTTTFDLLAWGAGGGNLGIEVGGPGGFASARATDVAGKLTVRVGGPGAIATGGMPGMGGGAGANGAGGGGFSGVFLDGEPTTPPSPATFLVIAAGGGGAGSQGRGGNAGGFGLGLSPGQPGNQLIGGSGSGNGSNGGRFFGGGGDTVNAGGGGGSGYNGGGGGGGMSGGGGGFSFVGNGATLLAYDNGLPGKPGNVDHPDRGTAGNPGAGGAVLVIAK